MGENPFLSESSLELLKERGYCFLPRFIVEKNASETASLINRKKQDLRINTLRASTKVLGSALTYSGVFGFGAFPLHTDEAHFEFPPRYLLLRCVTGFACVKTILVDTAKIVACLNAADLSRTMLHHAHTIKRQTRILRLLETDQDSTWIRWDTLFLRPLSKFSQEMVASFALELDVATKIVIELNDPGDTLIVDNWRMVHGRSAVNEIARSRVIERAYLSEVQ